MGVSSNGLLDQQVEELRERMHLLQQDRRANVDLWEANKAANIEEIRSLRDENKTLRARVARLQKSLNNDTGSQHELAAMRKELLQLRSEFDSLKVASQKHKQQLEKLIDDKTTCELEARIPNQEDGPLSRKIRMLENRLDKAMIKYNEAQSIKNTYEHIVKRLKEERINFDNQMTALERTLKAKERDYQELLLLSGDANHAREVVQHDLHKSRYEYEEKRAKRECEIRERNQVVKIRRQLLVKQDRRRERRNELIDTKKSEITVDLLGEHSEDNSEIRMKMIEQQERKLDVYEHAFRKIKDATGVSDVNEVIEKIIGQQSTTENLMTLTKQNQNRVEELSDERIQLKKIVEDVKYSGKGTCHNRKAVDDKQEELMDSQLNVDRCKSNSERIATTLIHTKAGVKHIQDKLELVRTELNTEPVPLTNNTLPDVLWSTGNIMVEILARIKESELSKLDYKHIESMQFGEQLNRNSDFKNSLNDTEIYNENRPYNQRVVLPSAKDDDPFETNSYTDDCFGDLDEDELSRDRVKKASTQIIKAQERKKAREQGRSKQ